MGRSWLLAIDESPPSKNGAKWCCNALVRPGDAVHLVAVTAPPTYSVAPAAPIATAGAVAALSMNWEAQRKAEEERGKEMLREVAAELAEETKVRRGGAGAGGPGVGTGENRLGLCWGSADFRP